MRVFGLLLAIMAVVFIVTGLPAWLRPGSEGALRENLPILLEFLAMGIGLFIAGTLILSWYRRRIPPP